MNQIDTANRQAISALEKVKPVLAGIKNAGEVMNLQKNIILTSGPTMPFDEYVGGQRSAIIGGALYEGFGETEEDVIAAFQKTEIEVRGCSEFDCVGSLAGVTTASMPVIVAEDQLTGKQAFCTLYEGDSADRLNYGSYTAQTKANLEALRLEVAPALDSLIQQQKEPVELKPIMSRALTMGDDLHSRNAAATLILFRQLFASADRNVAGIDTAIASLKDDYFFLRISMATSKLLANAMRGFAGSTIITAMSFNCKEFGIQTSGTGERWFKGPVPSFVEQKIEDGFSLDDMEIMGGESVITETIGLGGMAQAAAFPLVRASGGDVNRMIERTREMYEITFAESKEFFIPALNYRGVPLGIDLQKVISSGQTPYLNIGMAGKTKRQIGGGVAVAPLEAFTEAWKEFN